MRTCKNQTPIAVRTVDLRQPLHGLTDVRDYTSVRIFVTWDGRILGSFVIANYCQPISVTRLRQAIADNLTLQLLEPDRNLSNDLVWANTVATLFQRYAPDQDEEAVVPASRLVDLSQPLRELTDVLEYTHVRILVSWRSHLLGEVEIANHRQPVSMSRLRDAIVNGLGLKLLEPGRDLSNDLIWASTVATLVQHYTPKEDGTATEPERLPREVPVSIVVATRDRPDDLRECLRDLVAQVSPRRVEIVIVDNNPASGLTPPVVAEFPGVVLISEQRKGLSYARNAGIVASTGDIVIATDDDVVAPPDWLEKLVAPFARSDVMVVTGNVLPLELETAAQHLFEVYGGLGRGFKRFEVNGDWFESFRFRAVPTWRLGATANAAFRAKIFSHPEIGLMYEALGVGMPAGCSEDTYLFYKVLKAGYTIVYEPQAHIWHKHRRDMAALRRQIYSYSKGGAAYHLMTLFNDGDLRGLVRLVAELPTSYRWRIKERLRGRSDYPLSLILLEILGTLLGPWALWRSRQRVKREGRSQPYVPVSQRSATMQEPSLVEVHQHATLEARSTPFQDILSPQ
jgi:GT2 family glycosyltransferase